MSTPNTGNNASNGDVDLESPGLEIRKLQLEIERLEFMLDEHKRPRWRRAGFWVPWATTLAAILGLAVQWYHSGVEYERQRERAELAEASARSASSRAEGAVAQANSLLEDLRGDLGNIRRQIRDSLNKTDVGIDFAQALKELDQTMFLVDRTLSGREKWSRHLAVGRPQACVERLREGYAVGLDARLRIPAWVQYELTAEDLAGEKLQRDGDPFRSDETVPLVARAVLQDYVGSGFDRGHLAPPRDQGRSRLMMDDTFLLTNVAPQVPWLNRHLWNRLESATDEWVRERGQLVVIAGPVFLPSDVNSNVEYQVIGKNRVAVPNAFFKIVVDARIPSIPEVLAFLYPNDDEALEKGVDFVDERYRVTVDELERLTGLDFLSALPESTQKRVEASTAQIW